MTRIFINLLLLLPLVFDLTNLGAQGMQPLITRIGTVTEALEYLGTPVAAVDKSLIRNASSVGAIEAVLDKYCLFGIDINPQSRVSVSAGKAKLELSQNGWRAFLIKVHNQARITPAFGITCEEAKRVYDGGEKLYGMGGDSKGSMVTSHDINERWLDMSMYFQEGGGVLSGEKVEYFIIQLYSRDAGKRAAKFTFPFGQASNGNEIILQFNCLRSKQIPLNIVDANGTPTTASLTIKDSQGRIYPSQTKRLAPDLFFEKQIYRSNGDTLGLAIGNYTIEYGRGAEYVSQSKAFEVQGASAQALTLELKRWIDPTSLGYYSGDSHMHASGCSHYTSPTKGVTPKDMMLHILGEGVNVGVVLVWGRGYDYQKQFFEGKDNTLSTKETLLHYDMEISVFPSGHAGHLVLLDLKDQNYPQTKAIDDWPTYTIPILRWAKNQGAVNGYAHSGLGLEVKSDRLPNYELPKFDGIGANEYVVSVTQDLVDFISAVDTPPAWELNIWYHTLNCGFRTRIVGETDYPCLSDEKVAHGRSYVKMNNLSYKEWTEGLKAGRSYVSEGKSHLMDFSVGGVQSGTQNSELRLMQPSTVKVTARVAALLNQPIDQSIGPLDYSRNIWEQKPFWNIERARIGKTNTVPVELVVNGEVVATKPIEADGKLRDIAFDVKVEKSSWVTMRILPSSHTNPVFVLVDNKPVRASRKSAAWCLEAVQVCWDQKKGGISAANFEDARLVYEAAKMIYRGILEDCKE